MREKLCTVKLALGSNLLVVGLAQQNMFFFEAFTGGGGRGSTPEYIASKRVYRLQ
jgi:hypothetical protein